MYCISLNQDSNYLCNIFVSSTSQSFLFVHFIDIVILEGKKGTLALEMFLNIWFQKMEPIKSQHRSADSLSACQVPSFAFLSHHGKFSLQLLDAVLLEIKLGPQHPRVLRGFLGLPPQVPLFSLQEVFLFGQRLYCILALLVDTHILMDWFTHQARLNRMIQTERQWLFLCCLVRAFNISFDFIYPETTGIKKVLLHVRYLGLLWHILVAPHTHQHLNLNTTKTFF